MTPKGSPLSIFPMPGFGPLAEMQWEVLQPGVEAAWLYRESADGPRAALLRYQPGASVPRHRHLGYEHIFVLEGEQADDDRSYPAGTLTIFPPQSQHRVFSASGCVVLAIWTAGLQFD